MSTPRDWQADLRLVDELMRSISGIGDPQELVQMYARGVSRLVHADMRVSLSRRGLRPPQFRVTRYSRWEQTIDPWREKARLPLLDRGIFRELVYADEPRIVNPLKLEPGDPAADYVGDMGALVALPQYDDGLGLNVVVVGWRDPSALDMSVIPNMHWQANLFGRATLNLVLRRELSAAYAAIDRELQVVGQIQRSLLPRALPEIPGVALAALYETSQRAGGDYYDLFPLPGGAWGLFIADVSGHGTPAAVLMAITHALAHSHPGAPTPPSAVLERLNCALHENYTSDNSAFVTAFYGVLDPDARELVYASAGHNPPRRVRRRRVEPLDAAAGLPLGIIAPSPYENARVSLAPGDLLVLYTDGVTETPDEKHELFGEARLDELLGRAAGDAAGVVRAVREELAAFQDGVPAADDRTLLVAQMR